MRGDEGGGWCTIEHTMLAGEGSGSLVGFLASSQADGKDMRPVSVRAWARVNVRACMRVHARTRKHMGGCRFEYASVSFTCVPVILSLSTNPLRDGPSPPSPPLPPSLSLRCPARLRPAVGRVAHQRLLVLRCRAAALLPAHLLARHAQNTCAYL